MSRVSFVNTDIKGIRFGDRTELGGKDKFQVIEEKWLKDKDEVIVEGVLSEYRTLRENYEFRRYDDAGKFYILKMDLKRKYMKVNYNDSENSTKPNTR